MTLAHCFLEFPDEKNHLGDIKNTIPVLLWSRWCPGLFNKYCTDLHHQANGGNTAQINNPSYHVSITSPLSHLYHSGLYRTFKTEIIFLPQVFQDFLDEINICT